VQGSANQGFWFALPCEQWGWIMRSITAQTDLTALNERFREHPAEEVLHWAREHYGTGVVLTCSFGGASGMVLLDMVMRMQQPVPIVFLDTDLLFPETYALAEAAAAHYGIAIKRYRPALTLSEQDDQEGTDLFARNPDRCCALRKVAPLAEALKPYQAWISGIRRDQGATRAETTTFQWSARHQLLKINPLAHWSEREVWRYINSHAVPYNPLLDRGYKSLGCAPCTRPTEGDDPRGGRWNGFAKVECGIHL
jgi:phosphoadenosine phosphosulfate reductase